jgi:hypothetical protein
MSIILSSYGGGGRGSVAALGNLCVKAADDGNWYDVGMKYDPVLGVYLWSVGLYGATAPDRSVNVSDHLLGPAYFCQDDTGVWHAFIMTPTDAPMPGYVWTDVDQFTVSPLVYRTGRNLRADDGLYMTDISGAQIHKMGVSGGFWSELNQGYTIPL